MSDFRLVKLTDPIQFTNVSGGLVPRGAFNAGTTYNVGDSVSYTDGNSYVLYASAAAGTLPTDTTKWQLLASKGNTGATGPTGPVGTGNPFSTLQLTPGTAPSYVDGQLYYNNTDSTLNWTNSDSNVTLQIGEENRIRVINSTGVAIANGSAVYINGQSGGLPTIALSRSNAVATSNIDGLVTENIAIGAIGYITISGIVRGIDTSAFAAGATVYLNSATAGALTTSSATSPTNNVVRAGYVLVSSATVGQILVAPISYPMYSPQSSVADLGTVLSNAGLRTAGTAYTITTSGAVAFTGSMRVGEGGYRSIPALRTAATGLSASSSLNNLCDATTASFAITLPAAAAASGLTFWFKKTDATANTITITRAGTDTIDGSTTYVLSTQYKYVEILSNGTIWFVRGNN